MKQPVDASDRKMLAHEATQTGSKIASSHIVRWLFTPFTASAAPRSAPFSRHTRRRRGPQRWSAAIAVVALVGFGATPAFADEVPIDAGQSEIQIAADQPTSDTTDTTENSDISPLTSDPLGDGVSSEVSGVADDSSTTDEVSDFGIDTVDETDTATDSGGDGTSSDTPGDAGDGSDDASNADGVDGSGAGDDSVGTEGEGGTGGADESGTDEISTDESSTDEMNADDSTTDEMNADELKIDELNTEGDATLDDFEIQPLADNAARIVINKRVLPGSTAYLQGATFRLYSGGNNGPTNPIAGSWATCTIGAPPATSCTIQVPTEGLGSRYWVVETVAAPGTFALERLALGSATQDMDSPSPYPGRTPEITNNSTTQMPRTGASLGDSRSNGETINALINPSIHATCNAGLRVALILDRSTSITSGERTPYANAVEDMVQALITPENNILITPIFFGLNTTVLSEQVASNSLASSLNNQIRNGTYQAGTHWQYALQAAIPGNYDVVLMVTDGAPSISGNESSASSVRTYHLERAVLAANQLKNAGTPVWAVGVAMPANAETNLVTISGKNPGDYFLAAEWEDLSEELNRVALGLRCTAEISVDKKLVYADSQTQTGVSGWSFTPSLLAGSDGTLAGNNVAKTTNNAVNSGVVTWNHSFTEPGETAGVTFTENLTPAQISDGWVLTGVTCREGGVNVPVTVSGNTWTIASYTLGDAIRCTVTNTEQERPADISWSKVDDQQPAALLSGSEWTITGPGHPAPGTLIVDCITAPCGGLDQDPVAGQFLITSLAWGTYTITETKAPPGHTGAGAFTVTINANNAGTVITQGAKVNPRIPGTVIWQKVSAATAEALGGSEWNLIGPGHPGPTGSTVTDCITAPCLGLDQDPAAGSFRLEGLAWGDYTLVETKAPLGHIIDQTENDFTVAAATVGTPVDLGGFTNVPVDPLAVPLTGGIGRDHVMWAGALVLIAAVATAGFLMQRRQRIEAKP